MTLRPVAAQHFERLTEICEVCGTRLIQYVPRCSACGAERPPRVHATSSLQRQPGCTRIAHLSDLHVGSNGTNPTALECFLWWIEELQQISVDALVISGDLVDCSEDLSSLQAIRKALEGSQIDWHVVPGNHDVPSEPGTASSFAAVFGRFPKVKRSGFVEFILLDSNAGIPFTERGTYDRVIAPTGLFGACITDGRVGRQQLAECDAGLAPERPAHRILVLHHHLVHQQAEPLCGPLRDDFARTMRALQDAAAVLEWAAARGVSMVLHGHKHLAMRAGVHRGGIAVLGGGSSTQGPPPFRSRIIDLDPTGGRRVIDVEMLR